ncbi:hypothetical protein HPB50_004431 [Hyalomma asiaticum]|uniref:Uncharacterized protein n=1 Tax=Hyalomma asiaticum TaxID=266040 RepID=A0ACB7TET5_HYAAI|nr:hypothetical protein HPB50_004431 [Hyalomma asiaticum]
MLTTRSCHLCARGSFIFKRARASWDAGQQNSRRRVANFPKFLLPRLPHAVLVPLTSVSIATGARWFAGSKIRGIKPSCESARANACFSQEALVFWSGSASRVVAGPRERAAGGRVQTLGVSASHDRSATAPLGPGSALTSRRDDAVARVFSENRARRLRASSGPTPPPYPFGWRVLARPAALLILRQRCCGGACGLVAVADAAQVTVLCPLLVLNGSVASSFHSVLSPARVPAQLWFHATKEPSHSRRHRNEKRRKCGG